MPERKARRRQTVQTVRNSVWEEIIDHSQTSNADKIRESLMNTLNYWRSYLVSHPGDSNANKRINTITNFLRKRDAYRKLK